MKRITALLLVSLLLISGCAWFETKEERTAQELVSDGMDQFNDGDYKDAIESFEKLKDWYPFSKFVILAELKTADAYYRLQKYEDAVTGYEDFENLHPRNEAIPYVIFQTGLCYFEQIDTIDRDHTPATKAMEIFMRLQKQFPGNLYANRAEEHIKKCIKILAGHEFYVAFYYFKTKHYKAALNRFKWVLANYPDVGIHEKALQYIALCEDLLKKQAEK
jgi:outer membrane protein assembly factor BamD